MVELEVDHDSFPASVLPESARAQFAEAGADIRALTILPWEEHCTECAVPLCYSTCDMYQPRKDGRCRRFAYGFGYVQDVPSVFGFVSRIAFKRWAQLLAYANLNMVPLDRARGIVKTVSALDRAVAQLPDGHLAIRGRRGVITRMMRRVKHTVTTTSLFADRRAPRAEFFHAEFYNPQSSPVELSFVIRDHEGPLRETPYQELLRVAPGFNRFRIPFAAIEPHIDPARQFLITFCPNTQDPAEEGMTLYMGLIAFVAAEASVARPQAVAAPYEPGTLADKQKYVKVVAWDLDHTLWDGILVEDGEERLRLKAGIAEVIKELDRRGIVNSVVSKNDADVALPVLQRMGLADYFVFPKISWDPKSQAVTELVQAFNVGADTVAVVDDSIFERSEILERCPGVRAYPAEQYPELLTLPEFRPALSDESVKRRDYYRAEERRTVQKKAYAGDYQNFLRSCQIAIQVRRTTLDNVARTHELIQRTNQLNFSGNRYSREAVEKLIGDARKLCLSIHCKDRFGDYGLVGFCVIDMTSHTVEDLMFSCRVQAKQVEHAFLSHLLGLVQEGGAKKLDAVYRRTEKNKLTAKVFDDLGFDLASVDAERTLHLYSFDLDAQAPRQEVVKVDWEADPAFPANDAAGTKEEVA